MICIQKKWIALASVAICVSIFPHFVQAHEGLPEQIVAITRKIKRDPKNASLYLQRGELYRLNRNWAQAAADYDHAARLQPGFTIVDLARGKMFYESQRFQRAKSALDRFLNQQPDHFEGLVTRARVLAKTGARLEAARDFTQAITLTPLEPELYVERAQVLGGDERYVGEALQGLDEGIKRLGPLVTLQLAAIDLELRRGSYDAALARLDIVMSQSERKETWLVRRGEILALAGRKDEARSSFQDALTAIDSLPPSRRQTRSMTALQLRIRSALGAQ